MKQHAESRDEDQPIFADAEAKFNILARDLRKQGLIERSEISRHGDVKLALTKHGTGTEFAIYVYPGGEVFSRKINGAYETFETAYDREDKNEVLDDLLAEARRFMEHDDYTEEVYAKKGKVVYRRINYVDGTTESSSPVFAGKLRRLFGTARKVKRL